MSEKSSPTNSEKSRVWDLPTRCYHWALTVCFVGAVITVENGFMQAHLVFGISIFTLILFRLIWGLYGSDSAKFKNFLPKIKDIWHCLINIRQKNKPHIGHDALGGFATFVMLIMLFITPTLGMFANDDLLFEGPLAEFVSQQASNYISSLHENAAKATIVVIGIHISAVLFYWLYKKDNIITPMLTGKKMLPPLLKKQASEMRFVDPKIAILCLICAMVIAGIILV